MGSFCVEMPRKSAERTPLKGGGKESGVEKGGKFDHAGRLWQERRGMSAMSRALERRGLGGLYGVG